MKEKYMRIALNEAKKAYLKKEVPIGAIIVKDDKIIARAHNIKESTNNPCGHAEVLAIQKACKKIGDWRLEDCEMYVTLEPCMMCVGSIIQARLKKIYIGAVDTKTGAVISKLNGFDDYIFNHKVDYEIGVLAEECSQILKDFFKELRNR